MLTLISIFSVVVSLNLSKEYLNISFIPDKQLNSFYMWGPPGSLE